MEFLIAETFSTSLLKLNANEQKQAKITVIDLQLNPAQPSLQFHRIDKSKDPNFWSIRSSLDIRIIVHKTASSFLVCYVDHHDDSYKWAEKRRISTHPKTGATQIVEVRERIEEQIIYLQKVEEAKVKAEPLLFDTIADDTLLNYGVPEEWIEDVKQATESTLLDLADHLPSEASEALLELATGGTPETVPSVSTTTGYNHPDAQRRFKVITDEDELAVALEYPWEKWTIFLHPSQRAFVEKDFNGPAKVTGSAGTGKTIVAIHRAVSLAKKYPKSKVLLTTLSDALAIQLKIKLKRLVPKSSELLARVYVESIPTMLDKLLIQFSDYAIISKESTLKVVAEICSEQQSSVSANFVTEEFYDVIAAWNATSLESYTKLKRMGRRTRIGVAQKEEIWNICSALRETLKSKKLITEPDAYHFLLEHSVVLGKEFFSYTLIDEAQDLSIPQVKFFGALAANKPNALFLAGDIGQRIFQQPFAWSQMGVNIRGRSRQLKVNYRTSHQIRSTADQLLPETLSDADGHQEARNNTISVFNGPDPVVKLFENKQEEIDWVSEKLHELTMQGIHLEEMGLFVRSEKQFTEARAALKAAGIAWSELERTNSPQPERLSLSSMHLAKGLEFRVVIIMSCDDEVVPLSGRIEAVTDESTLEEIYATERHLLYVACTRAREQLYITASEPESEFLLDFE